MENQVEVEEKTRLINQVLELQHTLEGNTHVIRTHTHIHNLLSLYLLQGEKLPLWLVNSSSPFVFHRIMFGSPLALVGLLSLPQTCS